MREKQIEELAQVIAHNCIDLVESSCGECVSCVSCLATNLHKEGATIQQWIPVTERLPEKQGEYIVKIEWDKRSTTLYYDQHGEYWFDFPDGKEYVVTHWMPLP